MTAHNDTPRDLDVDVATDRELDWYFGYAERAHALGALRMLPVALRPSARCTDDAVADRARTLFTRIRASLLAVPAAQAAVLRAVYTRRTWPERVAREFRRLAPVAVRLTCAANPWPARGSRDGLESAAARALARMLAARTARPAVLRREAKRITRRALHAYSRVRADKGTTHV